MTAEMTSSVPEFKSQIILTDPKGGLHFVRRIDIGYFQNRVLVAILKKKSFFSGRIPDEGRSLRHDIRV